MRLISQFYDQRQAIPFFSLALRGGRWGERFPNEEIIITNTQFHGGHMRLVCSVLLFSLLSGVLAAEEKQWTIRSVLPVDTPGTIELSYGGSSMDLDVDTGFGFGGDILYSMNKNVKVGIGTFFLFDHEIKDYPGAKVNFQGLYGMVQILVPADAFVPYAFGKLGYSTFNGNTEYKGTGPTDKGGVVTVLGAGFELPVSISPQVISVLFLDVGYAVNRGEVTDLGSTVDEEYGRFQLSFGIGSQI